MARKRTGFDRETRRTYDALMRGGYTQKATAAVMGVSTSSLYRWRTGRGRISPKTSVRIEVSLLQDDTRSISIDKLTNLNAYYSAGESLAPHQRRSHAAVKQALRDAKAQGLTDPEDRVPRPLIKVGMAQWYLGRGKDEVARKAWERSMRAKGVKGDLRRMYDEATGYTSV